MKRSRTHWRCSDIPESKQDFDRLTSSSGCSKVLARTIGAARTANQFADVDRGPLLAVQSGATTRMSFRTFPAAPESEHRQLCADQVTPVANGADGFGFYKTIPNLMDSKAASLA
jgi:hypothetical protein